MGYIIGLDSVVFIYLLEANPEYLAPVQRILNTVEVGKAQAVFSSLGMIEILTGPKKLGRFDLVARYKETLAHFPSLTIMGLNEYIVDLASDLRARYNLATPDAIHLATALAGGAQKFITNDKSLQKVKEIKVELL